MFLVNLFITKYPKSTDYEKVLPPSSPGPQVRAQVLLIASSANLAESARTQNTRHAFWLSLKQAHLNYLMRRQNKK